MSSHRAAVLSIAGSDPSGGAGIQTDLKTFTALGADGMAVITMLTAQSPQSGVQAVHVPHSDFLEQQLNTLLADEENCAVDAIKIGALGNAANVRAVSDALRRWKPTKKVVLDPVIVATAGGHALLETEAMKLLLDELVPICAVWTPNLPEAAKLLGTEQANDEAEMLQQCHELGKFGAKAVLLKGGHLTNSDQSTDILFKSDGAEEFFRGKRLNVNAKIAHGTGCRLSSAMAVYLARGHTITEAVQYAKRFVEQQIGYS
uniref:HMP-P kinase/HMP-PP kinase n=1 Tax=Heterodera glycines TaxID=51029 RepID=F1LLP8_HETGL|nr:HMP-P kinase/HMP-PP kinase [Heterodera glycines]